jgi:Mrp family chromosome partitioning ATPase
MYDYIIIDTPPLIFASELMSIAKHVDGIVINIRAGVSTKGALRELLDNLDLAGVNVLGVIFNGVIESKMGGYYSGGRYYNYRSSRYAKRYYTSRYNSHTKKQGKMGKVRGSYRKNYLHDLRLREKSRNRGTLSPVHPFMDKRQPFVQEAVRETKIVMGNEPALAGDLLESIEMDPRAQGRPEE